MKCSRCGDDDGNRMEMRFHDDARIGLYLCVDCVAAYEADEDVAELVPARRA